MRHFISLLFIIVFAGSCFGITPTSSLSTNLLKAVKATATPPAIWSGTITLGLTATAGNVDSVLVTSKVISERKTQRNDLKLNADGAYGEADSVKNAECLHGSAQDNQTFIDDTWYGYGRGEALHDGIADVDYRITTGGGVGYYFIKSKMTTLSSEAGPAFQTEKLDDEYNNYPSARVAENFERKIDDHARVWENFEVIPPLTVPDAFLINAEIGVETPLTRKLSLQTYVDDNFANVPAPGYKPNDVRLISGIVFKF
jgi:putative salt-induced outer membrane protein YdiY